jgi:hypothetical protein
MEKMSYQDAKKIRSKSFGDIMANKLAEGQGIGSSFKATLSEKSAARMKGFKEKFDSMNIAKFVTGGSKLAPALLGRLTGRSSKDIKYFAGVKDKKGDTATKLEGGNGGFAANNQMIESLLEIYDLLKDTEEYKKKSKEEQDQFAEENKLEKERNKDRRHKELMEAITGEPYETATKIKKEDNDGTSLMDSLFGRGAFKMLGRLIRFAISPLGLVILGFTAAYELVSWLAENTPDMKIPDASGALAILESGQVEEINRYKTSDMTGREVLEDIVANGKQNAKELLEDTEGNAEEIKKLGGLEAVKKLAAMEIPDLLPIVGKNKADKLDFTKEQFIGTGLSKASKEKKWEKEYAPFYNDDGTKKTQEEIYKNINPQAELYSMNEAPEQAFRALNENPNSLKSEPAYASNMGNKLNEVQAENLQAKIEEKTAPGKTIVNTAVTKSAMESIFIDGPLLPVRNMEETYQDMILYSTRIV